MLSQRYVHVCLWLGERVENNGSELASEGDERVDDGRDHSRSNADGVACSK